MENNPIKQIDEQMSELWEGPTNFLIRVYYYLILGLGEAKTAQGAVLGILGLYAVGKFTSLWWMAAMTVIVVPSLIWLGWFKLYKVGRPSEFVGRMKSTVLKYDDFNNQVQQTEVLNKILIELEKLNKKSIG